MTAMSIDIDTSKSDEEFKEAKLVVKRLIVEADDSEDEAMLKTRYSMMRRDLYTVQPDGRKRYL